MYMNLNELEPKIENFKQKCCKFLMLVFNKKSSIFRYQTLKR